MSSNDFMNRYAPGLCSADPDQTAGVIVNVETLEDADEATGIPMDTSFAPEADVGEATAEVAEAAPEAEQAQTSIDDAQDANDLQEALNHFVARGRGMTDGEQMLVNLLVKQSQRRTFRGAPTSQLINHFSGGLNSATGGVDQATLIGAVEAGEKGFKESVKAFIAKIVEFFKKIANAVKKWVSGSEKLKSRAEEIKKRASKSEDFAASSKEKVSVGTAGGKLGNGNAQSVLNGVGALATAAGKILSDGVLMNAVDGMVIEVNKLHTKSGEKDFKGAASKVAAELEKALPNSTGSKPTGGETYFGGLQVGVQANLEDYNITVFAKTLNPEGGKELETLPLAQCTLVAERSIELLNVVIGYQDNWKKRDETLKKVTEEMKASSEAAGEGYSKTNKEKKDDDDTRDGMVGAFMKKRKITNACGHTLLSVQRSEATVLGHCLTVASAAIGYAEGSLKNLSAEKKKADKKAEKNKSATPAAPAAPATP